MKILIVDDSIVFRSQIKAALSALTGVEIVGSAANGKIALARLQQAPVDLVTLDLEMPEMNGLETLREIRRLGLKTRVIMFSSMTQRGGESALEALRLGADDVVAKPSSPDISIENASQAIAEQLLPRVQQFLAPTALPLAETGPKPSPASPQPQVRKSSLSFFKPSVIVIGSSTGGPSALENIFQGLRPPLRIPILITQHMPPVFTKCLADRLQNLTGIPTDEARDQQALESGRIYIAPGNHHMSIVKGHRGLQIQLDQGPPQNMVRPAVDPLFVSAARHFGDRCMGFILTGMGEDGCLGCRALKEVGGRVMIQDRESCVVFGMPGAVYKADLFDDIGNLTQIQKIMKEMTEVKSI